MGDLVHIKDYIEHKFAPRESKPFSRPTEPGDVAVTALKQLVTYHTFLDCPKLLYGKAHKIVSKESLEYLGFELQMCKDCLKHEEINSRTVEPGPRS